jgi:hypothetical protein
MNKEGSSASGIKTLMTLFVLALLAIVAYNLFILQKNLPQSVALLPAEISEPISRAGTLVTQHKEGAIIVLIVLVVAVYLSRPTS